MKTSQEIAQQAALEIGQGFLFYCEESIFIRDSSIIILRAIEEAVAADRNRLDWMQSREDVEKRPIATLLNALRDLVHQCSAEVYNHSVREANRQPAVVNLSLALSVLAKYEEKKP